MVQLLKDRDSLFEKLLHQQEEYPPKYSDFNKWQERRARHKVYVYRAVFIERIFGKKSIIELLNDFKNMLLEHYKDMGKYFWNKTWIQIEIGSEVLANDDYFDCKLVQLRDKNGKFTNRFNLQLLKEIKC